LALAVAGKWDDGQEVTSFVRVGRIPPLAKSMIAIVRKWRLGAGPSVIAGMIILDLNAFLGDSESDKLVAAAEEERFRRVEHWAGFPLPAIAYCLREAGLALSHVAVNQDSRANFF
jgi:hypothetical protein